jgi:hypothetical protein
MWLLPAEVAMHIMYERCAGLDVHKKTVVVCVLTPEGQETRPFGTMTAELLALADWLLAYGCTHVAIERTGDYWKPVFNILEGICEVILVNAQHVKAVPGRKTDVNDAARWAASSAVRPNGAVQPAGPGMTHARISDAKNSGIWEARPEAHWMVSPSSPSRRWASVVACAR